jgi:hypothetical protein
MRTNLVVNPKLPGIADGQQGSFIRMKQKSSHPCTMPSVHINFRLLSVFLLLLLPGFLSFCPTEIYAQAAAPAKPQPPATVLLIRHAEKLTDGRIDLSPTGCERARLLPKVFSPAAARPDLPTPQDRAGGMAPWKDSATSLCSGATPLYTPWPDTQYDRICRIDYANGQVTLQDLPYASYREAQINLLRF